MYNFEARAQAKGLTLKSNNLMLNEVTLFLDEDLIRQLLVNVFENSIRYTDNPGMIKVSIKNKKETIELWIEDSSPSVPLTALDKLFGRLYRVDQSRSRDSGGSGLGLSICKNIIEQHNGSISAQISSLGGVAMIVSFKKQYNEGH
ncbi:ATP-binding protein [Pseudoalteromonas sp. AOP31-A2-14]